jgi:arylsulfatase A-like enzyme
VPVNNYPLPKERVTLAEIARDAGYRTVGMSANTIFLSSLFGMDQGFQDHLCETPSSAGIALRHARDMARRWDPRWLQHMEMPYHTAPEITGAAISWLDRNAGKPFFMFLNYMEVHKPNAAPGTQGLPLEGESLLSEEAVDRYIGGGEITPAERKSLVNEYDRELIYLDHWLEVLFDHLDTSGLSKNTLVIVTADHGEFLGEHQLIGHGLDLHGEVVNVPMIVWEPGRAPGRESRAVQVPDVFPTALRYMGLRTPEGTQAQPLFEADHPVVSELHYAGSKILFAPYGHRFDRVLRTIRAGDYRYFDSSNGEQRLFKLPEDPDELRNLVEREPGELAAARARLQDWLAKTSEAPAPTGPTQNLDEKALDDLRTLGYIR